QGRREHVCCALQYLARVRAVGELIRPLIAFYQREDVRQCCRRIKRLIRICGGIGGRRLAEVVERCGLRGKSSKHSSKRGCGFEPPSGKALLLPALLRYLHGCTFQMV